MQGNLIPLRQLRDMHSRLDQGKIVRGRSSIGFNLFASWSNSFTAGFQESHPTPLKHGYLEGDNLP